MRLRMYVWREYGVDYTSGIAVAVATSYGAIVRHRREQLAARAAADLRWAVVSAKSVGRKEVTACAT